MPFDITATQRNLQRIGDKHDEILDTIVKEFASSESTLSPWKRQIVKYYELYSMVQRNKNYIGLANIFVPETLRAVETIVAKLYQMIFGQTDWMEYAGRDNNGDDPHALALTLLTRYQMDQNNFKAKIMDALRQMVITGLCVRKVGWDYQEVERQTGEGEYQIDSVKDTWTVEAVDLLTFHISDMNTPYNDLQKAEWIGEEYQASKAWFRTRVRRGWFSDEMKAKYEDDGGAANAQSQDLLRQRFQSSGFTAQDKKTGQFLFQERWGLVPAWWVMSPEEMEVKGLTDEDRVEAVVVVMNRKAIVKIEANPWWHKQKPYVACPYVPKEFELAGMGVAKIGESLQEEINDTRNQVMDNKTLILSTMWLKSRGSGIKDKDLVIRQNGVITTNDMEGLVALRPPVVAGVGTNMEGVAKSDLRESSGAASNLQGIAQPGVGTATEATTINRESLGRLLLSAQLFAELVLKPIFCMSEFLNYQFYDHVKVINIIGPTGVKYRKLKPEEIKGGRKDVIIRISLDATENPAVMRQQFLNFFTLIQSIPPEAIPFYWKFLDKIYGMFFNGHDLSELFPVPDGLEEPLSPQEERDCVLAEQPVVAKRGQNHKQYLDYHVPQFKSMQNSMNENQFMLYEKLIETHFVLMQQELMEFQAQMAMQAMTAQQGADPDSGNMINKGKTQNTTPFNQKSSAPSTKTLQQGLGG